MAYATAIRTAERSVDRLSRAMEAAEEEVEVAIRRTSDVQKSQSARKELEMAELRRVIAAKEKSIDSLRQTLDVTKRTLEMRLRQAETTLSARDAEIQYLDKQKNELRAQSEELKRELEQHQSASFQARDECTIQLEDLRKQLDLAHEQNSLAAIATRRDKIEKENLQQQTEELEGQLKVAKQRIKIEADRNRDMAQMLTIEKERNTGIDISKDKEIARLKQQLKDERRNFKKAKSWLKAELRSREDMEKLLLSLRQIATGPHALESKHKPAEETVKQCDEPLNNPKVYLSDDSSHMELVRQEFRKGKNALRKDTKKLRAELGATKQILSQALGSKER